MQGKITTEIEKKEVKPMYGGTRIVLTIHVEHTVNNISNDYTVSAVMEGIETYDPRIVFTQVLERHDNNEETVIDEALIDTLNDCSSSQLLGNEDL